MTKITNGLILHVEDYDLLDKLTVEEEGQFVRACRKYNLHGLIPNFPDKHMDFLFFSIKKRIDYDKDKYQRTVERNRTNGCKGGRPKNKPIGLSGLPNKPKKTNINDKTETDNKTDINTDRELIKMEYNETKQQFYVMENFIINPAYFRQDADDPFNGIPQHVFTNFENWIKQTHMNKWLDKTWIIKQVQNFAMRQNPAGQIIQDFADSHKVN